MCSPHKLTRHSTVNTVLTSLSCGMENDIDNKVYAVFLVRIKPYYFPLLAVPDLPKGLVG